MACSYVSCYIHYIFSTKYHRCSITQDIKSRLWQYFGGIAKENKMTLLEANGTNDHVHLLVILPATLSIAKAIQYLKGGSSKWIHDQFPHSMQFSWQEGYGAFSVSRSGVDRTIEYIRNQETHHRTMTFEEEYVRFLDKYGVTYEMQYVFD